MDLLKLLELFRKERNVIKRAPWSFSCLLIVAAIAVGGVEYRVFKELLECCRP